MKLLLDENLSRRIIPFIQQAYPDSSQVALLGLESASDQQVWDFAKRNGYVIVSKDSDFYDLSLLQGTPPQIIWVSSRIISGTPHHPTDARSAGVFWVPRERCAPVLPYRENSTPKHRGPTIEKPAPIHGGGHYRRAILLSLEYASMQPGLHAQ